MGMGCTWRQYTHQVRIFARRSLWPMLTFIPMVDFPRFVESALAPASVALQSVTLVIMENRDALGCLFGWKTTAGQSNSTESPLKPPRGGVQHSFPGSAHSPTPR